MRLYKILNRYIDLDHVLSITDPEIKWTNECYEELVFEITLAFKEKPLQIIFEHDNDIYREWETEFLKANPGRNRDYIRGDFLQTQKHKMDQIHRDFLTAWQK